MRYGYFDDENREYVIERPDVPVSWTNYLGVTDLATVISHNAGGYSFYKSAEHGRVTRFRQNGVPLTVLDTTSITHAMTTPANSGRSRGSRWARICLRLGMSVATGCRTRSSVATIRISTPNSYSLSRWRTRWSCGT